MPDFRAVPPGSREDAGWGDFWCTDDVLSAEEPR